WAPALAPAEGSQEAWGRCCLGEPRRMRVARHRQCCHGPELASALCSCSADVDVGEPAADCTFPDRVQHGLAATLSRDTPLNIMACASAAMVRTLRAARVDNSRARTGADRCWFDRVSENLTVQPVESTGPQNLLPGRPSEHLLWLDRTHQAL